MKRPKPIRLAAISLAVLALWCMGVAIWGTLQPSQDPVCGRWHSDYVKFPSLRRDEVAIQRSGSFQRFVEGNLFSSGTWKPIQASCSESPRPGSGGIIILSRVYFTEAEVLQDPDLLRQRQVGTLHPVSHAYVMEESGLKCIVIIAPDEQRLNSSDFEWTMKRAPSRWAAVMDAVREWWRKFV